MKYMIWIIFIHEILAQCNLSMQLLGKSNVLEAIRRPSSRDSNPAAVTPLLKSKVEKLVDIDASVTVLTESGQFYH